MQEFTEEVLPNGIRVCHFAADFPVSSFEILLPIGSGHAGVLGGAIPDGAPHFLEHMQMLRSSLFPDKGALEKIIGLEGGYDNAHTDLDWTSYEMTVPVDAVEGTFPGLVDRVFKPIFHPDDFENQVQIIVNEREHRQKFFPGRTPTGMYYNTEFMDDMPVSLNRIFGSNDTMKSFTSELLSEIQAKAARTEGVTVFSAGSHSLQFLKDVLSTLPKLQPSESAFQVTPVTWVNKEYREVAFDTVSQPTLEMAWICPKASVKDRLGLAFFFQMLCNSVHGHLYQILRHEKGWVYDLDWYLNESTYEQVYGFTFPVMDTATIQIIRQEIYGWMEQAIGDQAMVEREIHRRFRKQVTWYETAGGCVETEADIFRTEKRQVSYVEWCDGIESMRDEKYRQNLFQTYLDKKYLGELAFLPS